MFFLPQLLLDSPHLFTHQTAVLFFFLFFRNKHILKKKRQNLIKNTINKKTGETHMYRDTYTQNTHKIPQIGN